MVMNFFVYIVENFIIEVGGSSALKANGFTGTIFELTRINKIEEQTQEELYQSIEQRLSRGQRFTLQTLTMKIINIFCLLVTLFKYFILYQSVS